MLNQTARLSKESGLSKDEAFKIWNQVALSGFRTIWPWVWIFVLLSIYIGLRFWVPPEFMGPLVHFLTSTIFLLALFGAFYISNKHSYAVALKLARKKLEVNNNDGQQRQ